MRRTHLFTARWLFISTLALSATAALGCSGTPDPGGAMADTADASMPDDVSDTSSPDDTSEPPSDTIQPPDDTTEPPGDTTEPPDDTTQPPGDTTDPGDMTDTNPPSCTTGTEDCDGDPNNGCETNLLNSVDHCGACGITCPSIDGGAPTCASGVCSLASCDPGLADCDGNLASGCEVNTTTDLNNCGGCGITCSLPTATAACVDSACAIDSCDAGFDDCDADATNGCEVATDMDPDHCGGCGIVCDEPANGTRECAAGACGIGACDADFDDCDGQLATGCEVALLTDTQHCGGCNNACPVPANATAVCNQGACVMGACQSGYLDVDGDESNGCEVQVERQHNEEVAIGLTNVVDFTIVGDSTTNGFWASVAHTDGSTVWNASWLNATGTDKTIATGMSGARVDRASYAVDASFVAHDGAEFAVAIPGGNGAVLPISEQASFCTSGCTAQGLGSVVIQSSNWQTVVTSGNTLSWYQIGSNPVSNRTCEETGPFFYDRCLMDTVTLTGMTDLDLLPFNYQVVVNGLLVTRSRVLMAVARSGRVDFFILDTASKEIDPLGFSITGLPTSTDIEVELLPSALNPGFGVAVAYAAPGSTGDLETTVEIKRFTSDFTNFPSGLSDTFDHTFTSPLGDVDLNDLHALDGRHLVVSQGGGGIVGGSSLYLVSEAGVVKFAGNGLGESGEFGKIASAEHGDRVVVEHGGLLRVYELIGLP